MTTQMNKAAVGLTAVAVGLGMAASANAVSLKITQATPATLDNKVSFKYSNPGDPTFSYTAKEVMFKAVNTAKPSDWFYTFCTDIGVSIKFGQTYEYNPVPFVPTPTHPTPAWTANGIQFAAQLYKSHLNDAIANPVAGTGLQLAIWEVLYDSSWDLTGGKFTAKNTLDNTAPVGAKPTDFATTYLSQLSQVVPNYPGTYYQPVANQAGVMTYQGLIRVPEGGATLALLGMGLMGLAGLRRKLS